MTSFGLLWLVFGDWKYSLALWVGVYAGLAVGFAVGHDPAHYPWAVAVVWVAVWTTAAWLNARIAEKVVERGWAALRVGSGPVDLDDEDY